MSGFANEIADRIADWPDEALAELLKAILNIELKHFGVYPLSDDERAAVKEGRAQAERREFVSDEQVATFFNRFRS